ncbi:CocE/NonD family hydrolase [Myxococcus hansupus]|uniref:CocE/NonD family hydrolase n=1 Tax=Pseudomyxococcus hansupus TaxID=1297742 RepID=UPI0030843AA9
MHALAESHCRDGRRVVASDTPRGFDTPGGAIDTAGPKDLGDLTHVIDWVVANTPAAPARISAAGVTYGAGLSLIGRSDSGALAEQRSPSRTAVARPRHRGPALRGQGRPLHDAEVLVARRRPGLRVPAVEAGRAPWRVWRHTGEPPGWPEPWFPSVRASPGGRLEAPRPCASAERMPMSRVVGGRSTRSRLHNRTSAYPHRVQPHEGSRILRRPRPPGAQATRRTEFSDPPKLQWRAPPRFR